MLSPGDLVHSARILHARCASWYEDDFFQDVGSWDLTPDDVALVLFVTDPAKGMFQEALVLGPCGNIGWIFSCALSAVVPS